MVTPAPNHEPADQPPSPARGPGDGKELRGADAPGSAWRSPAPVALAAQTAERRAKRDGLKSGALIPIRPGSTARPRWRSCTGRTPTWSPIPGRVRGPGRRAGHGHPGPWPARFATMEDSSGAVQLMFQARPYFEEVAAVEALVDVGDWVGVTGELITSRQRRAVRRRERSGMLSKALRPLPDKWHGVSEAETGTASARSICWPTRTAGGSSTSASRLCPSCGSSMAALSFVEVETPILQPQAGGAIARPFMTHANALDTDFSLRIAPELYLKRLVVGGSSASSRSPATSATRASTPATAPSSLRWRPTALSATSPTAWTSPST